MANGLANRFDFRLLNFGWHRDDARSFLIYRENVGYTLVVEYQ